ncbi:HAD family hydrolase [Robertmurraya siralis]|uniref:HAD family hydrolase n=1 Tax=Robertmurraya siralis TaxID=77777 RepID=UPI0010F816B3|nr:HAD family phosphatase [Robertmurraya siralis]
MKVEDTYAVIFDMDGVIVDSEPVYRIWNRELFQRLNITVPEEIRAQLIGGSTKRKWQLIKEHCRLSQTVEDLIQYQYEFFRAKPFNFKDVLFSGVLPLIVELKSNGISVALASSSDKERINRVLTDCGLQHVFDAIVSGEDFADSKPHPEIFLHTAKLLGKSPQQCIVIEDSTNGLLAATRAAMKKVAVRHHSIKMDLSLADLIIDSLEEVNPTILAKML